VKFVRRTAIWIPVVVVALLAMPLMLTNRSFGHDWTLHLWLVRQQQLNIDALGHPGLFVSARNVGVFYPMYAFVGSGLYTAGGTLAILLGGRPILAYKLLYIAGFGFAYGGMTWLSLQLGLRGWRSQVPGLVLVTGTYFITDLAGRGDLGEFVALTSIPLLIAAGRSVFTASRIRTRDLIAVVAAVFVLTGSHNITLMWGVIFIVLLLAACFAAFVPGGLPPLPWPRLAVLAGSGAIGVGLNAWFLAPDLRYGLDTDVALQNKNKVPQTLFATPNLLLNPLRPSAHIVSPYARDLRYTLPWMFALWAVIIAAVMWRHVERFSKRAFIGVLGVSLVYVVLITWQTAWNVMPHVLYNVQFPSRLHAYVLIATALLVMFALVWQAKAPDPLRRTTTALLVAFIVFNVVAATWQVWRVRPEYVRGPREVVTGKSFVDRVVASRYDAPISWNPKSEFLDVTTPLIATDKSRVLTVPATAVHASTFAGVLPVPDGPLPFRTNISAGPRFVTMTGIRAIGRSADDSIVAVRAANVPPTGPIPVTIAPRHSTLLRAGVGVSVLSAVLFAALLLWALSRLALGFSERARRTGSTSRTEPVRVARSGARAPARRPGSS
jgi:hypothetical protein